MVTTPSTTGQVEMPAALRSRAGWRPGVRFDVAIDPSGALVLRPLPRDPLLALRGMFVGPGSLTEDLLAERLREREPGRAHGADDPPAPR